MMQGTAGLATFAYRVNPGPTLFGGALAGGQALATVTWQALCAATSDPVDALRSEW